MSVFELYIDEEIAELSNRLAQGEITLPEAHLKFQGLSALLKAFGITKGGNGDPRA